MRLILATIVVHQIWLFQNKFLLKIILIITVIEMN